MQPNFDKAMTSLRSVVHRRAGAELANEESLLSLSRADTLEGINDAIDVGMPESPRSEHRLTSARLLGAGRSLTPNVRKAASVASTFEEDPNASVVQSEAGTPAASGARRFEFGTANALRPPGGRAGGADGVRAATAGATAVVHEEDSNGLAILLDIESLRQVQQLLRSRVSSLRRAIGREDYRRRALQLRIADCCALVGRINKAEDAYRRLITVSAKEGEWEGVAVASERLACMHFGMNMPLSAGRWLLRALDAWRALARRDPNDIFYYLRTVDQETEAEYKEATTFRERLNRATRGGKLDAGPISDLASTLGGGELGDMQPKWPPPLGFPRPPDGVIHRHMARVLNAAEMVGLLRADLHFVSRARSLRRELGLDPNDLPSGARFRKKHASQGVFMLPKGMSARQAAESGLVRDAVRKQQEDATKRNESGKGQDGEGGLEAMRGAGSILGGSDNGAGGGKKKRRSSIAEQAVSVMQAAQQDSLAEDSMVKVKKGGIALEQAA